MHSALYLGAEVKKFGGNEEETLGQCFQWLGAGVKMLRNVMPSTSIAPPLLGWVVVGPRWDLYMAAGGGNGPKDEILIFGPIGNCSVLIDDCFTAFKLLRLVERVKCWARNKYWQWNCKNIMEPLKAHGTNVDYNDSDTDSDEDMGASGQKV